MYSARLCQNNIYMIGMPVLGSHLHVPNSPQIPFRNLSDKPHRQPLLAFEFHRQWMGLTSSSTLESSIALRDHPTVLS